MNKSVLVMFHLFFWIFTACFIEQLFQWAAVQAWFILYTHPAKGTYEVHTTFPVILFILSIGSCVFYASYFSLNFFLKRPLRLLWVASVYISFTLIISLPASPVSSRAFTILGPVLYFNVFGFLFRIFIEWLKDRKLKAELEKDKVSSQLELLKSKIDPHFLFNNLNNIDAFIEEDPKQASVYLKKLSDILRFMLYESNADKVALAQEIAYIQKYIDLQKIRTANASFVTLEVTGDTSDKTISPMILIHFIENAFKYASNKKIKNAITIQIKTEETKLVFHCKNHINERSAEKSEKSGIGSQLLKQKLDLLYSSKYRLFTKEENNWYLVTLEIQLDDN
ncbi:hypothetical protein CNR22_18150 [Sphingobacteriaceae bacterium]|nr:hypothetical protein CNR22_18150 [Sphingobacteriaceae bacterium]